MLFPKYNHKRSISYAMRVKLRAEHICITNLIYVQIDKDCC